MARVDHTLPAERYAAAAVADELDRLAALDRLVEQLTDEELAEGRAWVAGITAATRPAPLGVAVLVLDSGGLSHLATATARPLAPVRSWLWPPQGAGAQQPADGDVGAVLAGECLGHYGGGEGPTPNRSPGDAAAVRTATGRNHAGCEDMSPVTR